MMMAIRRQQQYPQTQSEPLKCPRCDSTNTKFCYYNNYNESQPRHFCRTCKRHWTKGGTLRNVPVGGGRKNKRHKKSSSAAIKTTPACGMSRRVINNQITVQNHNQRQNFPLVSQGDQRNLSELTHHSMLYPGNLDGINYSTDQHGLFLGSNSLPSFSFFNSSSFETKPYQPSDIYNYSQDQVKMIDRRPAISFTHPMNLAANTSPVTDDMANYWNWEDMNTFVATDLNLRWDD